MVEMIKGKTKSGFEFAIAPHVLDSMELLDAIMEIDETFGTISKVVKMLLPADQRKRLYEHLRTEEGNVPIMAVVEEVAEIFQYNQLGKN